MAEERDIKYVNKDFNDFRTQLIEYAKNYFPNTYNDFSPTSPGMMFIEMAAYVGDILSFYQDSQLQETYLTYAKDPKNLYSLAYMMGYRPKTTGVSTVDIQISQRVGVDLNYLPDWGQSAIIPSTYTLTSTDSSQTQFIIDRRVDFSFSSSYDPTDVIINSIDNSNNPEEYLLRKKASAYSSEIKSTTFTIGPAEKFKTITISDNNIVGILDIVDSAGNYWYEVPFLGQDTIFADELNGSSDSNKAPWVLKLQKVPRRFITRHLSSGYLQIQFGAGTNVSDDSTIIPDPSNVGLGSSQGVYTLDKAYDPTNFTYSKSYGIAPSNTTLTIRYLKGGGASANVPANTISSTPATPVIKDQNGGTTRTSSQYLTFNNPLPAVGGRDGDTIEEIRENSLRAFSEQKRAVTLQDYNVRVMSLPSNYGSVAKVYAAQDQLINTNINPNSLQDSNPLALSLYVLAYDNNRKLVTASSTLKNNIKTYLSEYMMMSDAINLKDAFVVNIGVNYDIVIRPQFAGRDVLLQVNNLLKDYFNINKWGINQPINIGEIASIVDKVKGVQTVQKVEIVNKQDSTGATYSRFAYDTAGATKNQIVYPSFDPCIFEVKYPDSDIKGRITAI
jgi:hypothetical protein